jgi:membrane-associated protease RseP (regulator of RpoE activity)
VSARADDPPPQVNFSASGGAGGAGGSGGGGGGSQSADGALPAPGGDQQMFIRALATADGEGSGGQPRPWLGVGVEESSEALSAQLDLRPGEGLVVDYVSSNSPAALSGLQKNDVLVDLDGQMLVDATQLRKLVQMHAIGDAVTVSYFHAGKKHSVTAKLTPQTLEDVSNDGRLDGFRKFKFQTQGLQGLQDPDSDGNGNFNIEIQRELKQAQAAVQNAMRQEQLGMAGSGRKLEMINKSLGNLAAGGVSVGKDATVIIKDQDATVRTVVKKDDTGSYVIVADPAKHLTAHDPGGKLLFDGAIETPEQQQKVPKVIWDKVGPMLKQMNADPTSP